MATALSGSSGAKPGGMRWSGCEKKTSMPLCHKVIVVPGLGNHSRLISWAVSSWQKKYGLDPVIYSMDWRCPEPRFQAVLDELAGVVDRFVSAGHKVSFVGCSAGASVALNAYCRRTESVHRVVSVCGRLKTGNRRGFRSLKNRAASSPVFAASVRLFEQSEPQLEPEDRKRIMTVRALFGDEVVPAHTISVPGSYNSTVPVMGHVLAIAVALGPMHERITNFISSRK